MANFRDGNLQQGAPLGMLIKEVSLVADDTVINVDNVSLLKLSSDNATANNRTFTITNGQVVGHALMAYMASGGGFTAQLADSGNVKLSAAWEPLQYDTLSLVWSGVEWLEVARADN